MLGELRFDPALDHHSNYGVQFPICKDGLAKLVSVELLERDARTGLSGEEASSLQSRRRGEVDPKTVSPALVTACHLRRDVAKLLLHITLINLGRGSQASAQ